MCSRIASFVAVACLLGACSEPDVAGIEGMELTGLYTYMADAAVFEDCDGGMRYPVLIEMAHVEVERNYLQLRPAPGQPLLLTARFSVVTRAPEPGMPPREHLRVVEFIAFEQVGDCPR